MADSGRKALSGSDPEVFGEEQQDGVDFQTSYQHEKGHPPFGKTGQCGKAGEIVAQSGSDIADGGQGDTERLVHVEAHREEQAGTEDDQHQVEEQKAEQTGDDRLRHGFVVEHDRQDGIGVDVPLHFVETGFEREDDASDFDIARSGARHGSRAHEQHQQELYAVVPAAELLGGESGRGDDGNDMENAVADSPAWCLVLQEEQQQGQQEAAAADNDQVPPEFLVLPDFVKVTGEHPVHQDKAGAGQEHEHGDDRFDIGGIPVADAGVAGGESARGHGREGVTQGIEPVHGTEGQQYGFGQCQTEIDEPHEFGRLSQARAQLFIDRTGDFCGEKLETAEFDHRHDGQRQQDNAHAAQPLDDAAPEQDGVGQGLHILQDGGSGSGESGHGFEEGVGVAAEGTVQLERYRTEQRKQYPDQGDNDKALVFADIRPGFPTGQGQGQTGRKSVAGRPEKYVEVVFMI